MDLQDVKVLYADVAFTKSFLTFYGLKSWLGGHMHSSFGGQAQTRDKVERRRTLSKESLIPAPVVARQHWPDHGQHVTCKAETSS